MKRIRKLLSLMFLLGMIIDVSADTGTINYSLTMNMADVAINEVEIEGTKFSRLTISDFDNANEDNEPSLPVKFVSFQVPTYCNNISARILSSNLIGNVRIDNPVVPGLNIPSRSDFTLTPEMYATTGDGYTLSNAAPSVNVCDEFFVNGNDHIVTLCINPTAYRHEEREINFYSDIQVELSYKPCGKSEMRFEPFEDDYDIKMIDVAQMVENPDDTGRQRMGSYVDGSKTVTLKNYVIIVPENLESYVGRLAKWKEEKGYSVKVQTVEGILNNPNFAIGANEYCFDKESSVRHWLKYWRARIRAPFFCLIVGDYRTSAPIRKFYAIPDYPTNPDPQNPNAEDYNPTDAYFSDLVSTWRLEKYPCGLYSCDIDTASFSPTIPIGRLLCHSGAEIERYTDKLLLYELYPGRGDTDYLLDGFVFQEYDAQIWKSNTIFDDMPKFNVTVLKDNHASVFSKSTPTGKDIVSSMNKKGIVSWQGHGDPISIECAKLDNDTLWPRRRYILAQFAYRNFKDRYNHETQNGLDCMTNDDYPCIAYSLSCNITPFDAFKGDWDRFDNEYNMGSSFTVAGNYGGVALLGNTRVGYFTYSSYLEREFGKHLMSNSCIGIAEMFSKTTVSNQNSVKVKRIKFRHNIIGEPEFNIWTSKPEGFNGTATISNGILKLSGNSIENGFYSISSKFNTSQTAFNVQDNTLSIPFSSYLTKCEIATVYLWRNNYLPMIQIVTSGKEIVDVSRDIFMTEAIFSAEANEGGSYTIGKHPAYLNIGANSNITVNALDKITSDGGIIIRNQGSLALDTDRAILQNDKVEAGGSLNVKAHNITLGSGVTIEAGASANFSTY